jgi:recombination protein RecR
VRNRKQVCIVEKASDIYAIERLNLYRGTYFVLHGLISPMEGISPEDLSITQLTQRVLDDQAEEIILALNPTVEGDVTAAYLARQLTKPGCVVTRLASGLPVGSELEYADQMTLGKAFEGRLNLR